MEISQEYLQDRIDEEHAITREAMLEAARLLQGGFGDEAEQAVRFWRLVEATGIDPQYLPEPVPQEILRGKQREIL